MSKLISVGLVGLGKMGLSHLAIIKMHPRVRIAAVCDSADYLLDVIHKYSGVQIFKKYEDMLEKANLDAVIISTPSRLHAEMVRRALQLGLHVFCEKPFVLDPTEGADLVRVASEKNVVNQVGYHYRFVAAFQEAKKLLDHGAIGKVTHALAEAYGPVVLRTKGSTWRTRLSEGGGCLYDYAAHPINLLTWYFGAPEAVAGTVINKIFSAETDDEVYSTLYFPEALSAQLCVNWTDESCRKMTTKLTFWGTAGKIYADRQEIQVYLRQSAPLPPGYKHGWNVRYTTDLTDPVGYYLRGEEYSSQLDHFVNCIDNSNLSNSNSFRSALLTDQVIATMKAEERTGIRLSYNDVLGQKDSRRKRPWWSRWLPVRSTTTFS